jgi:hypothetical protein
MRWWGALEPGLPDWGAEEVSAWRWCERVAEQIYFDYSFYILIGVV